jgi:hypothetical protein
MSTDQIISPINRPAGTPPVLVGMVLVLAPNARSFIGDQPVRHMVGSFRHLPDTEKPITMLGDASTTVCAYLDAIGTACSADEWTDGAGYPKLDDPMQRRTYEYLIVDNIMSYRLSHPSGLSEVVAGRDPRWQPVQIFGQSKVFRDVAGGN